MLQYEADHYLNNNFIKPYLIALNYKGKDTDVNFEEKKIGRK